MQKNGAASWHCCTAHQQCERDGAPAGWLYYRLLAHELGAWHASTSGPLRGSSALRRCLSRCDGQVLPLLPQEGQRRRTAGSLARRSPCVLSGFIHCWPLAGIVIVSLPAGSARPRSTGSGRVVSPLRFGMQFHWVGVSTQLRPLHIATGWKDLAAARLGSGQAAALQLWGACRSLPMTMRPRRLDCCSTGTRPLEGCCCSCARAREHVRICSVCVGVVCVRIAALAMYHSLLGVTSNAGMPVQPAIVASFMVSTEGAGNVLIPCRSVA
jgi:hypothetical protein